MLNLDIKKEDLEKLPLELAKTIPSNWYYEKESLYKMLILKTLI